MLWAVRKVSLKVLGTQGEHCCDIFIALQVLKRETEVVVSIGLDNDDNDRFANYLCQF